jgi:hypothetical protein
MEETMGGREVDKKEYRSKYVLKKFFRVFFQETYFLTSSACIFELCTLPTHKSL